VKVIERVETQYEDDAWGTKPWEAPAKMQGKGEDKPATRRQEE